MLNINFEQIRALDNSQNEAFEEFICQLARQEKYNNRKEFLRIGKPDGGVECYTVLNDESEIGWQAKYFTSDLNENRFRQIDKSVKTALETHSKLKEYIIAIPINPSDSGKEQNTMLKKWEDRVTKWRSWAKEKGMKVQFNVWWKSDIILRLQEPENTGMVYFWFNKDEFTNDWFKNKLEVAINDLGNRYTAKLNFELDIAKFFDGIANDEKLKNQFDNVYNEILIKANKLYSRLNYEDFKEDIQEFISEFNQIRNIYSAINFTEVEVIDFNKIISIAESVENILNNFKDRIRTRTQEIQKEKNIKDIRYTSDENIHKLENQNAEIHEFFSSLNQFIYFIKSKTALMSNVPFMILDGKAGVGKSHLIADIAIKRLEEKKYSLLLLGQHFMTREDPWVQIKNRLGINCNIEEFLGAMNSKAQIQGSRIIIFIDAINEGEGRIIWPNYIKGFIKIFQKYKWLGLVLSIRESYVNLILPKSEITDSMAIRLTHYGFEGVEYEAVKLFFNAFGIELPSTPILHPEFSNPLFLMLFCQGIINSGLKRIPEGIDGITSIINFYISSINGKLSKPEKLDYPEHINLVLIASELIAKKMFETKSSYLLYDDAFKLVEKELKNYSNKVQLLEDLISEGVLSKNLFWTGPNKSTQGVYFAYERFMYHLIASYLLENYIDKTSPEKSFSKGGELFYLVENQNECFFNSILIEALSIQIPEIIDKEFYEIAIHAKEFDIVIQAFIKSLIWRRTDTITNKLMSYINEYVLKSEEDFFWETILTIATNPNNYYNANFLHKHLMNFSLPNRDGWWTQYIHNRYPYEETSIKRLIDWAWDENDKCHFSDESIRLASITIAWFLTSTNRTLRDSATKSLICLLENRIDVLTQVLENFEKVNDPYVYERLFCVAYGCTIRTKEIDKLAGLSEYIYKTIFIKKNIYPHILLRDYARGIIEYSLLIKKNINIDIKKIRPPYKSTFPKNLPSNKYVNKYKLDYNDKTLKEYQFSQNSILSSMVTEHGRGKGISMYGDFGRYVFQSGFRNWKLDPQKLSNLGVKKIFTELGYDVEKHGWFDRNLRKYKTSRYDHGEERIGKKYQWIVFYELLARVSDNFRMHSDWGFSEDFEIYDGTWDPYVRDIDPTMLIKKTKEERYDEISPNHWWFNSSYTNWEGNHVDWIKKRNDLPNPKFMINVIDETNTEWLVLESYPEWSEPQIIGNNKWEKPHKRIWYQLRSYLIKQSDKIEFNKWAVKQNFMGRWMPESHSRYEIFSREYYWSQSYNKIFSIGSDWEIIDKRIKKNKEFKVNLTTNNFLWEEAFDYSKTETISFFKPSKLIYLQMKMRYNNREGEFLNDNNELICYDPSVNIKSLSCLLIRKKDFLLFLKQNKLEIAWTLIGEKLISGDHTNEEYFKRLIISGFYNLDNENIVKGKLTTYIE